MPELSNINSLPGPGEDPVAHWDASACSCDFGELTSMSAVQDIVLDYRLSVEAGGLVLREPALDVYFLSQIVQGGGRVFQREGDHLTLRKHIMPQKDMYPGCALAYLCPSAPGAEWTGIPDGTWRGRTCLAAGDDPMISKESAEKG